MLIPSAFRWTVRQVAALLLLASAVSGETYYVATTGSDANTGTSASPWRTLVFAATQVGPGDTVEVRAGTYQGPHITTSGSAGSPITFRAAPGEAVTISGDNPTTVDGINIEGADHVVIEGFHVTGASRAGIRAVLCEHVVIRNNQTLENYRWGIFTGFCDDLLIEGNQSAGADDEHGIYVSNSAKRPVIRGNQIWNNVRNGIHMNGDRFSGGDGIIEDALVEDNVIWDNGIKGGSGINMDGVRNSLVRNNLIYDSHASGISLYQIDGGAPSTGNRVFNNTVLVSSGGRWAMNIQDGATGNELRNNVFYSAHSYRGAMDVSADSLSGLVSDNNAMEDRFTTDGGTSVMSLASWRSASGGDASSFVLDLANAFVDAGAGDYLPAAAGGLRDVGADLGSAVPRDLRGVQRPQGVGYDIGALEFANVLFADGFESGELSGWSSSTP